MTPVDPELVEAFNRVANDASLAIGDEIIALGDRLSLADSPLPIGSTYYAVVVGSTTGALRVLNAAAAAGLINDADEGFRRLMAQMADIWAQIAGGATAGSTVQ